MSNYTPLDPPPSYEAASRPLPPRSPQGPPGRKQLPPPPPLNLPYLNALRSRRVILASQSPRRKMLLAQVSSHCNPHDFHASSRTWTKSAVPLDRPNKSRNSPQQLPREPRQEIALSFRIRARNRDTKGA